MYKPSGTLQHAPCTQQLQHFLLSKFGAEGVCCHTLESAAVLMQWHTRVDAGLQQLSSNV